MPQQEPTLQQLLDQVDQEHDSEDEGIQDYKIGGYHPVHVGEVINKRYVVIQKIGWGHFSTVWLAKDFKYDTYVALKVQKCAANYLEAAFDEVEVLQKVAKQCKNPDWLKDLSKYHQEENRKYFNKDDCQVVQLLNSFIYNGPYGSHFCFVFEILGVNLLEVIKRYNYQGVPMHLCRKIAKQCLIGLDFLDRYCSVIHTDLKPENVLLQLTQDDLKDIVENGQITKKELCDQRIRIIRRLLGLQEVDKLVDEEERKKIQEKKVVNLQEKDNLKKLQEKLKEGGLTKNQKKNLKKKINKKKNKLQEGDDEDEDELNIEQEQNNTQNIQENHQTLFSRPDQQLLSKNALLRGPKLEENFKLKIADLGNACYTFYHFSTQIQTRQYRSPEVLIGNMYNQTADIWSLACMLFELLTGDFLFEPRKGPNFSKNDDHLAQIQELCKKFPKQFALKGTNSKKYFDQNGNLRRIPQLHYWPLRSVLTEKYRVKEQEAKDFEDFMMQMLNCMPEKRKTAQQMLEHPWLKGKTTEYEYKMNENQYNEYMKAKQKQLDVAKLLGQEPEQDKNYMSSSDDHDADNELNSNIYSEDDQDEDDKFYDYKPSIDRKLVDRSFTNLGYIGYGDGINFGELDNAGNWQFANTK